MKTKTVQIIDKRDNSILSEMDDIIEYLQDILPHGSGIDSNWSIEYKPSTKKIYAHNSYHAMNEWGFYGGWYDFTVSYKLHDMNEHVPCKYCTETGKRSVKELAQIRNEFLAQTIEFLVLKRNEHVFYDEEYNPESAFIVCNVCHGKGYTLPNAFEFINLNLHGEGKYLERISYGTRDYLEELLYNPEDVINWTISQREKSV